MEISEIFLFPIYIKRQTLLIRCLNKIRVVNSDKLQGVSKKTVQ